MLCHPWNVALERGLHLCRTSCISTITSGKKKNKHGACIAISKTSMVCQTSLSYINNDPKETMVKEKGRNKYKEKMVG